MFATSPFLSIRKPLLLSVRVPSGPSDAVPLTSSSTNGSLPPSWIVNVTVAWMLIRLSIDSSPNMYSEKNAGPGIVTDVVIGWPAAFTWKPAGVPFVHGLPDPLSVHSWLAVSNSAYVWIVIDWENVLSSSMNCPLSVTSGIPFASRVRSMRPTTPDPYVGESTNTYRLSCPVSEPRKETYAETAPLIS